MSKELNTNFTVNAPVPIDSRMYVMTASQLVSNIAIPYFGLRTYVHDEDEFYVYTPTGWTLDAGGQSSSATWGQIAGDITDQSDLIIELGKKFNKTGGQITGNVNVLGDVEVYNLILSGSDASINGSTFVRYVDPPATSTSTGSKGDIAFDATYTYFCVDTDSWTRVATLNTF